MLRVYCYNKNGYHDGATTIKSDVKSLAKAIMYFGSKGNLMITDFLDLPVCTTIGTFIDIWHGFYVDYDLQELLEELIPMQKSFAIQKELDFICKVN